IAERSRARYVAFFQLSADDLRQDAKGEIRAAVPGQESKEENLVGVFARLPQPAHVSEKAILQLRPLDAELGLQLAPQDREPGDKEVFLCNQAGQNERGEDLFRGARLEPCLRQKG